MKYFATQKTRACLVILASFFASHVQAATIVLDFEGAGTAITHSTPNDTSIEEFYNGGTNSLGNSGSNFGISFSNAARASIDTDNGGSGNFAHEPSGSTAMYFTKSNGNFPAIMNVAAGFDTGFSFFYSFKNSKNNPNPLTITIFDGLNATGNILLSLILDQNYNKNANGEFCEGDPNGQYCNWDPVGGLFSGTGKSVDFGYSPNTNVLFDNLTLGSDIPAAVPLPGTIWLMGSSLLGLLRFSRKSQPTISS